MRIISDITNKEYKTVEECLAAEEAFRKEAELAAKEAEMREAERKAMYDLVGDLRKQYFEALATYNKKYGPYTVDCSEDGLRGMSLFPFSLFNK